MAAFGNIALSIPGRGAALWRRLTERSSSSFKFAFLFLGPEQRSALEQVYEFCRVVDDIVDERDPGPAGEEEARQALADWSREVARIFDDPAVEGEKPVTQLGRDLSRSHVLFAYSRAAFDEIIAGVAMDLDRQGYERLDDLRLYCYRVASCVGFLCVAIFGETSPSAHKYAEHLGLALQYTNILRDVAEDAMRGRVYLPDTILSRHDLDRDDILNQRYDARFVALATEFAGEAEREYVRAWAALDGADGRKLLPAEIMGRTYYRVLQEIRTQRFNVFTRRPVLRRRDKLKIAAGVIARTQFGLGI